MMGSSRVSQCHDNVPFWPPGYFPFTNSGCVHGGIHFHCECAEPERRHQPRRSSRASLHTPRHLTPFPNHVTPPEPHPRRHSYSQSSSSPPISPVDVRQHYPDVYRRWLDGLQLPSLPDPWLIHHRAAVRRTSRRWSGDHTERHPRRHHGNSWDGARRSYPDDDITGRNERHQHFTRRTVSPISQRLWDSCIEIPNRVPDRVVWENGRDGNVTWTPPIASPPAIRRYHVDPPVISAWLKRGQHVLWNVADHPDNIKVAGGGRIVDFRQCSESYQVAVQPGQIFELRIPAFKGFPWEYARLDALNGNGPLSVWRLFCQIWDFLRQPLTQGEFNSILAIANGYSRIAEIDYFYERRCERAGSQCEDERRAGPRRLDILGRETVFCGLSINRAADGTWYLTLNLTSPQR
ncbi:hypothetical protein BD410DRAFT_637162 [Rickenella mellea]|uniref:DUF6699 domain-containing protein n=1 Tax=Rickenella mellea TaxID=50990 RepID=A0A4Y7QCF7_9AGAM|nr:hypothetical protein BD410DRAFT_637162 [Rickenella mellea]